MMEPVCTLKRNRSLAPELCILCQESSKEKLFKCTEKGKSTLQMAAHARTKLRDLENRSIVDRLDGSFASDTDHDVLYHRSCYATFTSKAHISRLEMPQEISSSKHSSSKLISSDLPKDSSRPSTVLRSSVDIANWEACMFCQDTRVKERLKSVTTFNMSNTILKASKYDPHTHVRFSDVHDLIAAEGKYHNSCYHKFRRKTSKIEKCAGEEGVAMEWLVGELRETANKAQVLELSEVWNRYCDLSSAAKVGIPKSFISRRSTFKAKLQSRISDIYHCITLPERQTLLVPVEYGSVPFSKLLSEDQETLQIPTYQPQEDFLEMVHLALKLRSDVLAHPVCKGFVVSEDKMISCIPDSLFMFLRLMFGGQSLLEDDLEEEGTDSEDPSLKEARIQTRTLSIAQDIVYNLTGGKHWTPKHLGLASALHQATRSKELVELFHNAGHIISYRNILQVDTALAEKTMNAMDHVTGAVIPPNFVPNRFVHFTCDNIDINDTSFDGKNSFHATQVAGWQRGPEADMGMETLEPSRKTSLEAPAIMEDILPAEITEGKAQPTTVNTEKEWFQESTDDCEPGLQAVAKDMAFFVKRQNGDNCTEKGWTHFNQANSKVDPKLTSVGYMPIVQAPAHELDTLNTVVLRCKYVASHLGQHYVVLTVDEALYCKLMELKWAKEEYQDFLIVRLGGLHTAMNFLKVIGKHVQSSGLQEAWVESNMLGPKTAEQVMSGKSYARGMRAHKMTLQAMWRILVPKLLEFIKEKHQGLHQEIQDKTPSSDTDLLVSLFATKEFRGTMDAFTASSDNPNFRFWWSYMQMVQILLLFTRAQRDGLWKLHLHAFQLMLPFFMRYNHTNYARWGTVYISEMHQLPADVKAEFDDGNFVVKQSNQTFNQVDPDQSQEWLNGTGKKGGGIIGITKTPSALSRWALSYNLRSHLASDTKRVYGIRSDDAFTHNECNQARLRLDLQDEDQLLATLQTFKMFSGDMSPDLQNIATKDIVTKNIEEDLLRAREKGQCQLVTFVEERLLPCGDRQVKFRDTLSRNKPLTFSSLYEVERKESQLTSTQKVIKADRKLLQRLVTAFQAGRDVNLADILMHELMPVPPAIAEMNGNLRSGSKALLSEALIGETPCPPSLQATDLGEGATLIIDGQAHVIAVGKPQKARTFGDLADSFVTSVLQSGASFSRVDVIFDRYYETSIKSGARKRRGKGVVPVRRMIENRDVPLPPKWENFLALAENKADLERFLSQQLILQAPANKTIVASGGFSNQEQVESSTPDVDTEDLEACHEEADTRIILHCVKSQASCIVVAARDTDILVLLLAHFSKMSCPKVWMKAGTAKNRKYVPIHTLADQLPFDDSVMSTLPAFHSLTGSDSTSFLVGHSKKSCWKVFKENHNLLKALGDGDLTDQAASDAEAFICRVYNIQTTTSADRARAVLFGQAHTPETLPPTSDALSFHIKRAHYQAAVWRQADVQRPMLPPPETMGWRLDNGSLVPVLMSLPSVPDCCMELISCNCTKQCTSVHCKCKKSRLPCTAACKCSTADAICRNI